MPGIGIKDATLRPQFFSDFKVSNDKTTFTFTIRKGLKWSDGYPVTTEDVRFAWEDVALNKKITPVVPIYFRCQNKSDGELLKLEIMDDYTFRISFSELYGGFLSRFSNLLVSSPYANMLLLPAHYLKKFHVKYTSMNDLKPYLEKEGLKEDEWWTLFNLRAAWGWAEATRGSIGTPTLNPWAIVEVTPTRQVMERNPYYLAVDAAGNQLPYIDRLESITVSNVEAANLMILAGKVDFQTCWAFHDLPLFLLNEEKGGYKTHFYADPAGEAMFFNFTYDDPVWRKIVSDIRFRKAINMGMNKQEMIDEICFGLAELPIAALPPEFNEYNPEEANKLLDEVGLDKRDEEGYRLRPDGERFEIFIEINTEEYAPQAELEIEYLHKLGIKASMKMISLALTSQRWPANEIQTFWYYEFSPGWRSIPFYLPTDNWAVLWVQWYESEGREGEEPPQWIKELYEIDAEIGREVTNTPEYDKAVDKLYSWYRKYAPYVIWRQNTSIIQIVSKRLGNVPRDGTMQHAVVTSLPQMFFK
jgi:peptide/nickel transport system substrate-binding protein